MSNLGPWLLAVGLTPGPSDARPGGQFQLSWQAPPSCPEASSVRGEIEALLADSHPGQSADVQASGRLSTDERGLWTLSISLRIAGETTERTLQGSSCAELSSAASFIVATAIDPRVAARQPPSVAEPTDGPADPPADEPKPAIVPATQPSAPAPQPSAPAPQPTSAPQPSAPAPQPTSATPDANAATPRSNAPPPSPKPSRPRPLRFAGGVQGGVAFGPNPRVGAVVSLSLGLLGPRWRADVLAEYWTPSTSPSSGASGARVRVQTWDLVARGCWVPRRGRFEFPLCAGLGAGALHGRGTGDLAIRRRASSAWVRALAGPGIVVPITRRFAAAVRVDGFVTLARGGFRTDPSGQIHQPRMGGLTGTAGVEFRLP